MIAMARAQAERDSANTPRPSREALPTHAAKAQGEDAKSGDSAGIWRRNPVGSYQIMAP